MVRRREVRRLLPIESAPKCMPVTTADHHHVSSLLGAYVLDAVELAEQEKIVAHLDRCAVCRSELADLQEAVDRLPTAPDPSDRLWRRIAEEIKRRRARDGPHGQ